jgi:hypothetical protein
MLVILLISGFGGAFFHYALIRGIEMGALSKGPFIWSRCVAASALLFAVCASAVVRYFLDDVPYLLTLALWPVFILALEPAYRLVDNRACIEQSPEEQE